MGSAAVLPQPAVARPLAGPGHAHVHGAAVPPGGAAEPGRRAGGRPPRQRGVFLPVVPLPVLVPGEGHFFFFYINSEAKLNRNMTNISIISFSLSFTCYSVSPLFFFIILHCPPRQVGQVFLYFQW